AAAQLSRGLLPEISRKLTQQFADCLQASMAAEQAVAARPVSGLRLGLAALWAMIRTFFRNLFRRSPRA
ncbi:MAG: hypothetical protein ACXWX0_06930, partial [Actinomycetota bacterium]